MLKPILYLIIILIDIWALGIIILKSIFWINKILSRKSF